MRQLFTHSPQRRTWFGLAITASIAMISAVNSPVQAQVSVLTHHNDTNRTGANLSETTLKPSNVSKSTFGKLFTVPVDGQIYAQPLLVSNLTISGGTHNVVYVATERNNVYALDASTGQQYWKVNLGTYSPSNFPNYTYKYGTYKDMAPDIGITSTPVIDAATKTMYVVSFVETNATTWKFYLHALDITTGADKSTFNSPREITASVSGTGDGSSGGTLAFNAKQHNQRPALLLLNGKIFIAFASHGDTDPYHGWVIAYNAADLTPAGVWCDTPNGSEGGIWQAGNGPTADSSGNVYLITGNGTSTIQSGDNGYGETIVKLTPASNNTLTATDWFMPYNYNSLNSSDADLGASGLLRVPNTNYVVGGGKQGILYVINITNMGHYHSGSDTQVVQEFQAIFGTGSSHIHGGPVYYNSPTNGSTIYIWGENDTLRAFKFNTSTGQFTTTPFAQSTMKAPVTNASGAMPGGFMAISANGSTNSTGVLWAATPYNADALHNRVAGIVHAFDANTLAELWNDKQIGVRDDVGNFAKYAPPIVANGKVYVPTFGAISAAASAGALIAYGPIPSTGGAKKVTSVRYWPRPSFAGRMTGGLFQGSNDGTTWTTLATVSTAPPYNAWTTLTVTNTTSWRYVRYLSPNGGCGNVNEIEFYNGTTKLTGTKFGSGGSYTGTISDTFDKAEDGNTSTFFDGITGVDGLYIGLDFGP